MILFEVYVADDNFEILAECGDFCMLVEKKSDSFSFASKTSQDIKGFKQFKQIHSHMKDTGVSIGVSAIQAYKKNKLLTAKLFAKNAYEKSFYGKIAADLKLTGKYKVEKMASGNGTIFKLERIL